MTKPAPKTPIVKNQETQDKQCAWDCQGCSLEELLLSACGIPAPGSSESAHAEGLG